jgi:hypothetical protein
MRIQNERDGMLKVVCLEGRHRFAGVSNCRMVFLHPNGSYACRLPELNIGCAIADHPRMLKRNSELALGLPDEIGRGLSALAGPGMAGDNSVGVMKAIVKLGKVNAGLVQFLSEEVVNCMQVLDAALSLRIVRLIRDKEKLIAGVSQAA